MFGTGELFLDCVMHDLRKMYSEIGELTETTCTSMYVNAFICLLVLLTCPSVLSNRIMNCEGLGC